MNTYSSQQAVVPFCFNDHLIRTAIINEDPWFIAKDVCGVLELKWQGAKSIEFLDDDEKGLHKVQTPGGEQDVSIISESGLYTLVIRSNKPQAKPFRKWVTAEVLPQIRRTGSYQMSSDNADRRVEVKHTHLRGTTPPGSLDIRYTLDLSKILLHPTKRSLSLLQRLTGIDLADVMNEGQAKDGVTTIFQDFFNASYIRAIDKRLRFGKVYADYLSWCKDTGCKAFEIASLRNFGVMVRESGYVVRKSGGQVYLYDICRAEEVAK